jgi:phosphate transport system substrate-binding protein
VTKRKISALALSGILALTVAACGSSSSSSSSSSSASSSGGSVTGAGSTFAAPLYQQLGSEYTSKSGSTINYQSVGSGAGVAQFIANTVNFGATDVALKDEELKEASAKGTPLDIPTAFGAVTVGYNVPGVAKGLKLTGPLIAEIYEGKIKNWNDPKIASLNPGVKLPSLAITPVYRSDGSGTTGQFTQFLTDTDPEWAKKIGTDKEVKWPTGTGAKGNEGVAAATAQTSGAIGYIELAYTLQHNFTTAAVKNKAGNFVAPSLESTSAAGDKLEELPADLRFTAVNSPNASAYPIASATFVLVYQDPCKAGEVKDSASAEHLVGWIDYVLGEGQNTMKQVLYAPLPSSLLEKAKAKVTSMTCNGSAIKAS